MVTRWGTSPLLCTAGYQIGPRPLVLMINDLDLNIPHLWKFVDESTVSDVVAKGNTSKGQSIVNQVIEWSHVNRVQLNPDKYKELRISFARSPVELDTVIIYRKEVEVASTGKLLGLTISANLTWNAHIEGVVKKASKRFNFFFWSITVGWEPLLL